MTQKNNWLKIILGVTTALSYSSNQITYTDFVDFTKKISDDKENIVHEFEINESIFKNNELNEIEIEIAVMDNSGYPNNVKKIIKFKSFENIEYFFEKFGQLKRTNETFLVSVQKGTQNSKDNGIYVEIDENATFEKEKAIELFEEYNINIKDLDY